MEKINKLKSVIQEDISKINQARSKDNAFDSIFKYIDGDKHMLYLDFKFFIDIINTFCYEINYKDYDVIKGYVPEFYQRINGILLENSFIKKIPINALFVAHQE